MKRVWRRSEERCLRKAEAALDDCKTLLRGSSRTGAYEARGHVGIAQSALVKAIQALGDGTTEDA